MESPKPPKTRCMANARAHTSFPRSRPCKNYATVQREDGYWYCNAHDPVAAAERQQRQMEEWSAKWEAKKQAAKRTALRLKALERFTQQAAKLIIEIDESVNPWDNGREKRIYDLAARARKLFPSKKRRKENGKHQTA